jgi:hypothetical protein
MCTPLSLISLVSIKISFQNESPDPLSVYHDYCFPGRDPPALVTLARRLLCVSANSASCERLFSIFGNTLTKLRSCLGTEVMTTIGELKMYIRDEEMRDGTKKRLKRELVPHANIPATQPSTTTSASAPGSLAPAQDIPIDPALSTTETSPSPARVCPEPESEIRGTMTDTFQEIVDAHIQLAEEDNLENEPVRSSGAIRGPWKLTDLFDFTRDHWVELYSRSSHRSFQEELELYELLDLEEGGVGNVNVSVDDATAEVLLN